MKKINIIMLCVLFSLGFSACKKEYTELYSDNRPAIPVTYAEATSHGFNPYITQPLTKNDITLTLTIPEGSGRSIKEISKVHAGSNAINAGTVRGGTYISTPIKGQGNKVVFTTTLDAFKAYSAGNKTLVDNFAASTTLTQIQIAFMFLVVLDNNDEIIPVQAQVWLTK